MERSPQRQALIIYRTEVGLMKEKQNLCIHPVAYSRIILTRKIARINHTTTPMNILLPQKQGHRPQRLFGVVLATACTAFLSFGTLQAQVTVLGGATFDIGTGVYTYTYAVANTGPTFDLAIVNVPVSFSSDLMDLTAPTGFDIIFDPGVGIVSFFEDTDPFTLQTFGPSSLNGLFTFTSIVAPGLVTFDALDTNGDTYTGTTVSPIVPEPGSLALLGLAALAPGFLSRRRQSTNAVSINQPTPQQ